jgi:8-oxo-dGTP pyrophosphatase MutT (NUDIX family)
MDGILSRMTKKVQIIVALIALIATFSCANSQSGTSGPAGIVLYHREGDAVFLLLADHANSTRGWSSFGGHANPAETTLQTAARETEEETRGYFSREWLAQKIAKQKPVQSNGFSMYFVEVPSFPIEQITNERYDENKPAIHERSHYAWIPLTALDRALAKENPSADDLRINPRYLPKGSQSDVFWDVWIRSMHDARKQGALRWKASKHN